MSTENLNEALGEIFGEQIQEMQKQGDEFAQKFKEDHKQVEDSYSRLFGALTGKKGPKGPVFREDVLKIATILQSFPQLVPVVNAVIQRCMAGSERGLREEIDKIIPPTEGGQQ